MQRPREFPAVLAAIVGFVVCSGVAQAGRYVAYSLNTAATSLQRNASTSVALQQMGQIKKPFGIVFDEQCGDVIVVGETDPSARPVTLDDFVVALRAILKFTNAPLVSIDRTDATDYTGLQSVRFEGGIANTRFGNDLLEADVVLKKIGLGKLTNNIWGNRSYFDMSAEDWRTTGREEPVLSRFWFRASTNESFVAVRKGMALVKQLRIQVETQVMARTTPSGGTATAAPVRDEIGDHFAASMTATLDEVAGYYKELRRLDPLFRLTGLAEAIKRWQDRFQLRPGSLHYWLEGYGVERQPTIASFRVVSNVATRLQGSKTLKMEIKGGVDLRVLVSDLKDGSFTAFRDLVIKSRPKADALTWDVPFGNALDSLLSGKDAAAVPDESSIPASAGALSMSLQKEFGVGQSSRDTAWTPIAPGSAAFAGVGKEAFAFTPDLMPKTFSPNVGGVLLRGAATPSGASEGRVDLSRGNFSLVVDGQNAQLDPTVFRKFITALWAVYYGDQDPGISIDPIKWGGKDHLVRYIGRVINTDLGRVMREADYLMKKWAVGTERADIPGFFNPDDISGRRGTLYYGASSRFWFVPEDMTFKRAGSALVFDQGRMTVKTEFNLENNSGMKADPSNEEFARILTTKYGPLALKYPVLKDLFDYAKMTSLAKYLKESGVPLFWFLMANKDLILTEDSPGTVAALAKGSDYFRNIRIEGGVDMSTKGQYVIDTKALQAIQQAYANAQNRGEMRTAYSFGSNEAPMVTMPFSFSLGTNSYSVVPQHSLTSGKDRRGNRYQTDFAMRAEGFQATESALDSFKWTLLRYLRNEELRPMVQNLSESEIKARYEFLYQEAMAKAAKKIPPLAKQLDELKGKEFTSEADCSNALASSIGEDLAKKLSPFFAKYARYKTDLELVRWFNPNQQEVGPFGKGWQVLVPYQLVFADTNLVSCPIAGGTWTGPARIVVRDLISSADERFSFNTNRYECLAYVPDQEKKSQFIALYHPALSEYQLRDRLNNVFVFDGAGRLTEMVFSPEHRLHIDYLDQLSDAIDQPPFEIEPIGQERVDFRGSRFYRQMRIKNLASGSSEMLYFNTSRYPIAGYVPVKPEGSAFKILAILSDSSYQLQDKQNNQVVFNRQGEVDKILVSPDRPLIASISMANQRIDFKYTVDPTGHFVVSRTGSSREGKQPSLVAHYEYDAEGRLAGVKKDEGRTARTASAQTPRLASAER